MMMIMTGVNHRHHRQGGIDITPLTHIDGSLHIYLSYPPKSIHLFLKFFIIFRRIVWNEEKKIIIFMLIRISFSIVRGFTVGGQARDSILDYVGGAGLQI
jgi:hypothetical protein